MAEGLRETLAASGSNRPLQETLDLIVAQACRVTGVLTFASPAKLVA